MRNNRIDIARYHAPRTRVFLLQLDELIVDEYPTVDYSTRRPRECHCLELAVLMVCCLMVMMMVMMILEYTS